MPYQAFPNVNNDLTVLNERKQTIVRDEIYPQIRTKGIDHLKRSQNNLIRGKHYRVDSLYLSTNGEVTAGHSKVDIQTYGQSVTVAVVFIHPDTKESSMDDLIKALDFCLENQRICRVW